MKLKVPRCFYINLPIGGVSGALALFFLKIQSPRATKLPLAKLVWSFDPLGTILFLPSIVCLLLVLQWAGVEYPWHDWRIILLLVMFAVSLTKTPKFCLNVS